MTAKRFGYQRDVLSGRELEFFVKGYDLGCDCLCFRSLAIDRKAFGVTFSWPVAIQTFLVDPIIKPKLTHKMLSSNSDPPLSTLILDIPSLLDSFLSTHVTGATEDLFYELSLLSSCLARFVEAASRSGHHVLGIVAGVSGPYLDCQLEQGRTRREMELIEGNRHWSRTESACGERSRASTMTSLPCLL